MEKSSVYLQTTEPLYFTWNGDNFYQSILFTKKTGYEWLLNNFIIIQAKKNDWGPGIIYSSVPHVHIDDFNFDMWDYCPFIEITTIPRNLVNNNYNKFSDFIIDSIKNDKYVTLKILQSFYNDKHDSFMHVNFISGYDMINQELLLHDHFVNRKYSSMLVSFDKYNNAYKNTDFSKIKKKIEQIRQISLCDYNHTFDIDLLIYLLKNYITSCEFHTKDYRKKNYNVRKYGISVYDAIEDYLIEIHDNKKTYDWRVFTFLKDHKQLILLLLNYLFKHKYLTEDKYDILRRWKMLVSEFNKILNFFIMTKMSNNKSNLLQIKNKLRQLKAIEKEIIEIIIESLEINNKKKRQIKINNVN